MLKQPPCRKRGKLFIKIVCLVIICISMLTLNGERHEVEAMAGSDGPMGIVSLFFDGKAPLGWIKCDGRSFPIKGYEGFNYMLSRTINGVRVPSFGGDSTKFNIPNLIGKSPIKGMEYYIAQQGMTIAFYDEPDMALIGEVCLFPENSVWSESDVWKRCDGRELPISSYPALYSCIGATFGGDGINNFQIPNLSNKSPVEGLNYYIAVNGKHPGDYEENDAYIGNIELYAFALNSGRFGISALPCDGRSFNGIVYNTLVSIIGTNFGGTSASPKVPDLRVATPMLNLQYGIRTNGIYPVSN